MRSLLGGADKQKLTRSTTSKSDELFGTNIFVATVPVIEVVIARTELLYNNLDAMAENRRQPAKLLTVGLCLPRISRLAMLAQDYIKTKLEELKNPLGLQCPRGRDELVEVIFRLVMSKKFRKYTANDDLQSHIKNAIRVNVEKNEPINITFLHGAYKLWRLAEAPEADWAELFSLIYYTNWVKPICEVYGPGVCNYSHPNQRKRLEVILWRRHPPRSGAQGHERSECLCAFLRLAAERTFSFQDKLS